MSKSERLEIRFGEKDADLWNYIESFGLPKSSLVKKIIRDQMEKETQGSSRPAAILNTSEQVKETPTNVVEEKPESEEGTKPKSSFGGLAVKK